MESSSEECNVTTGNKSKKKRERERCNHTSSCFAFNVRLRVYFWECASSAVSEFVQLIVRVDEVSHSGGRRHTQTHWDTQKVPPPPLFLFLPQLLILALSHSHSLTRVEWMKKLEKPRWVMYVQLVLACHLWNIRVDWNGKKQSVDEKQIDSGRVITRIKLASRTRHLLLIASRSL